MDGILFLLFILWMISAIKKSNQKAEAKKKGAARQTPPDRAGSAQRPASAQPAKAAVPYVSPEGAPSEEGAALSHEGEDLPDHDHSAHTAERHVLKPSFETGHAHMETSITGDAPGCGVPQGENSILGASAASKAPASVHAPKAAQPPRAAGSAPNTAAPRVGIRTQTAPEAAPAAKAAPAADPLRFDPAKAREAFLAAEIFGKPKALRPRGIR